MVPTTERDQARRKEESEAAVGPLLARANLYRLRGQWNESVSVCTEALRVAPQSPTAHSLLGDIYEAQGKLDDAIQWFSMAVDLNPENIPDRAKLDRVLTAKRAVVTADEKTKTANGMAAATASPLPGGQKEKTLDKTIEWFDRTFPPGRSESIVRLILLVAVAIAGVIAVSAAFVYFTISRERAAVLPSANTAAAAVGVVTTAGVNPPSVTAGKPPTASGPIIVTPTPKPSSPPVAAVRPSPAAVPSASPPSRERLLAATITRALSPRVMVHSIQSTDAVMQISLELATQVLDETPEHTRERVLRVAAQAAHTAAGVDAKPQKTVVSVALVGGIPAFRGEVSASALSRHDPALLPPSELAALFTNAQWNGNLSMDKITNVPN